MKKTVVVIGAGPAGLVTAKTLLEHSTPALEFDPIVLEAEDDIGGTFRYRGYENGNLVSSKQLTSFSDFRVPLDRPDHFTVPEYVEYLRSYMRCFKFERHINLKCKVISVAGEPGGTGHIVHYLDSRNNPEGEAKEIRADYVAVCSGLHVTPSWPKIPGIEYVVNPVKPVAEKNPIPHEVYHSAEYKGRAQLAGRRVLILGTGETGHDIAYEAAKAGATEVILCTRGGFLSIPKVLNDFEILGYKFNGNLPIDGLITNLFETTYVHPWVARSHLRWFVSDWTLKRVLQFLTGTQAGCNQWVGELDYHRLGRAYVFLNKSNNAMPYINRSWRDRPWYLDYLSRYIDPPEDSPPQTNFAVELAPFPSHFDATGKAEFPITNRKESERIQNFAIRPQTVVYATGYTQKFDFLDASYATPDNGRLDIRDMLSSRDPSIAFMGFVRPNVGAIPPLAEMQAMLWVGIITGKVNMPRPLVQKPSMGNLAGGNVDPNEANGIVGGLEEPEREHYHLLQGKTARIRYGVDHGAYTSTLALDMGSMPGLWELWLNHGTHITLCYCLGAAFTPFYRLTGPFAHPSAPETVRTELWNTITRRGILGNLAMGLIPMIFYGILNTCVLGLEIVWVILGRPGLKVYGIPPGYLG